MKLELEITLPLSLWDFPEGAFSWIFDVIFKELVIVVILKNHLRLLFIYKSQLLIFWLYTIMQSINNKFLVFKNDQNL